jgi:hypothetical protein
MEETKMKRVAQQASKGKFSIHLTQSKAYLSHNPRAVSQAASIPKSRKLRR